MRNSGSGMQAPLPEYFRIATAPDDPPVQSILEPSILTLIVWPCQRLDFLESLHGVHVFKRLVADP